MFISVGLLIPLGHGIGVIGLLVAGGLPVRLAGLTGGQLLRPALLVMSILLTVYLVALPFWRRSRRRFLCSTEWAQSHDYQPGSLRLYGIQGRIISTVFFVIAVTIVLAGVVWPYVPGTLFITNGYYGTGWYVFKYKSGESMMESYYFDGTNRETRWYRPDGSLVAETVWDKEREIGYLLWEDGTIRITTQYEYDDELKMYVAEGKSIEYHPDGTVDREVMYINGQPEGGWKTVPP